MASHGKSKSDTTVMWEGGAAWPSEKRESSGASFLY